MELVKYPFDDEPRALPLAGVSIGRTVVSTIPGKSDSGVLQAGCQLQKQLWKTYRRP